MLIEGMTDAEYEEFQRFYKKTVPKYFGTCIPDEGQFRIKTAIANDLGKYLLASKNTLTTF